MDLGEFEKCSRRASQGHTVSASPSTLAGAGQRQSLLAVPPAARLSPVKAPCSQHGAPLRRGCRSPSPAPTRLRGTWGRAEIEIHEDFVGLCFIKPTVNQKLQCPPGSVFPWPSPLRVINVIIIIPDNLG